VRGDTGKLTVVLRVAAGLFLMLGPGLAHHSFSADCDVMRPVRLEGAVVKLEWTNPHVAIYVDVKSQEGALTRWMIEAASPNALSRRGVTKVSIAVGMEVVIEGFQAKSGAHRASGTDIILPTGQKLLLRSDGSDAP
jgi:hypothetical protein